MLGLMLVCKYLCLAVTQNFAAHMLDSVCGAVVLTLFYPEDKNRTQGLDSNGVGKDKITGTLWQVIS